jgi:hypothetical protein
MVDGEKVEREIKLFRIRMDGEKVEREIKLFQIKMESLSHLLSRVKVCMN